MTRPHPAIVPFMVVPVDRVDVAIAAVERREGKAPLPCSERSQSAHGLSRIEEVRRRAAFVRTVR